MMQKAKPARRTPRKISESFLHNSGLYYLQRFAASRGRFRSVMTHKIRESCRAHPEQDEAACLKMLDELIVKFERCGLLDDKLYARAAARSLSARGVSLYTLRSKLKLRGLDEESIDAALADLREEREPDAFEFESALRLARRRRLGPFAVRADAPAEKAAGALARAGFDYDTIRRILTLNKEEAERLIAGSS